MNNLLILGAGSHGKVVAEATELEGKWNKISFLDDKDDLKNIYNFNVVGKLGDYTDFVNEYEYAFVAIGNNEIRLEFINKLIKAGYNIPIIIHPKAFVSKYSELGIGTVVLAGAVVNVSTTIGIGCIININASVDHDCEIECGVHISSGAVVRGGAKIGKLSNICAGACVKPNSILKERFILSEGMTV